MKLYFLLKLLGGKIQKLLSSLHLPVALIPPPSPVLELLFVSVSAPPKHCTSFLCFSVSHAPLFAKIPRHLIAHLYPALHYLLPLPIPWCLRFLPLHPSVCISLCGQTGILASGPPPLSAPLWDVRFSPGKGSYYCGHAKRLTTCHEKIVECQGHKN